MLGWFGLRNIWMIPKTDDVQEEEENEPEEEERKRPAGRILEICTEQLEKMPRVLQEIGQGEPQARDSGVAVGEPVVRGAPQETRPAKKVPKLDVENRLLTSQKIESPVIKSPTEVNRVGSVEFASSNAGNNGVVTNKGPSSTNAQVNNSVSMSVNAKNGDETCTTPTRPSRSQNLPKAPPYQPKPFSGVVVSPSTAEPQPPSWRLTGRKAGGTSSQSPTTPGRNEKKPADSSGSSPAASEVEPGVAKWKQQRLVGEDESPTDKTSKKDLDQTPQPSKFGSFTPPVRKESAETERKAHSKKQRETRRSTQGITLEQIQTAQQQMHQLKDGKERDPSETKTTFANDAQRAGDGEKTHIQASSKTSTSPTSPSLPPWRSRVLENAGQATSIEGQSSANSDFPLKPVQLASSPPALNSGGDNSSNSSAMIRARPATVVSHHVRDTSSSSSSHIVSAKSKPGVCQENNNRVGSGSLEESPSPSPKEESIKACMTPSATALRRRTRHNRRSTGPVAQGDIENLEKEEVQGVSDGGYASPSCAKVYSSTSGASTSVSLSTGSSNNNGGDKRNAAELSRVSVMARPSSLSGYGNKYPSSGVSSGAGSERSGSRTSSVASLQSSSSVEPEIDYKKLYEKEKDENEKLRKRIKEFEKQLENQTISKNSHNEGPLSDRERRSFERRISELEEDAKTVEQLRTDNQRLKHENGALIRVISKLSK